MKVDISPEREAWLEHELTAGGARSPAQMVEADLQAYERHLVDLRRDLAEAAPAIEAGEGTSETAGESLVRMRAKIWASPDNPSRLRHLSASGIN